MSQQVHECEPKPTSLFFIGQPLHFDDGPAMDADICQVSNIPANLFMWSYFSPEVLNQI